MNMDALRWQQNSSLFYPWIALLVLGWLMVASASTGIAEDYTGNPAYFAIRHAVYLAAGIAVAFATSQISMSRWAKFDGLLLLAGIEQNTREQREMHYHHNHHHNHHDR